jgi:hypothetical protein
MDIRMVRIKTVFYPYHPAIHAKIPECIRPKKPLY